MKQRLGLLFVTMAFFVLGSNSYAGKVEDVQAEVKSKCSKDLPKDEALRSVKDVYLSCVAGSKVDVGGCSIDCKNANAGAEVGKSK